MKKDKSAQNSTANLLKAKEDVQTLRAQYQQYQEYLTKYLILLYQQDLQWSSTINKLTARVKEADHSFLQKEAELREAVSQLPIERLQIMGTVERMICEHGDRTKVMMEYEARVKQQEVMFLQYEEEREKALQRKAANQSEVRRLKEMIEAADRQRKKYEERATTETNSNSEKLGEVNDIIVLKKRLNNELQEARGNIRVYCRIRPFDPNDPASKMEKCCFVQNESCLTLVLPKDNVKSDNQKREHKFNFERVFENTSQNEVFNELSQLIQSAIDGKNVCVFAYGQTGSGKTHTMEGGDQEEEGVIPRSANLIFDEIEKTKALGWKYDLQASIAQVYMENVRDLLNLDNRKEEPSKVGVNQVTEIRHLLHIAHANRKVAETNCNEHSSRSHCIFQLTLTAKNKDKERIGTLTLIDLAGSQRVNQSKVEGDRLKETMSINKSLTQLNTVITAIAKKQEHVPYRNSKLTRILENYLSGDSKTLMIVTISPKPQNHVQTLNSLRFAETVTECILHKK